MGYQRRVHGEPIKTKMSQTSTTIINILFFAFLLMTTISSTNIKKNNTKPINDIAHAPAASAQPAKEERQTPTTRQERLEAFIKQRHQRIQQEKERFEEKVNNTIQRREQSEEKFQEKLQDRVNNTIQS